MGFEEFCGNSITISGKEMIYKYHIYSVKIGYDRIFVVLSTAGKDIGTKDNLNNVYCYDNEGNLMWQIQQEENVKYKRFPIQCVEYDNKGKRLVAFDDYNRKFEIDENTGKILKLISIGW